MTDKRDWKFVSIALLLLALSSCKLGIRSTEPTATLSPGALSTGRWFLSLTDSPPVDWALSGNAASLDHYEYSVGNSAGATDLLAWTSAGKSTRARATGLSLTSGNTYYFNVRTVEPNGARSSARSVSWVAYDLASQVFNPRVDYALPSTSGNGPRTVVVTDLDGDGYPDLFSTGNDNKLSYFAGQSGGNFGSRNDLSTGTSGQAVSVADLDRDGKLDLTVTCFNNPTGVNVFRQTGSLTFAPVVSYTHSGNATSADAGDLNGDGYPDIAIADYLGHSLGIYLNGGSAGPGALGAETQIALTSNTSTDPFQPKDLKLADLRGNGKLDAILTNESDTGSHAHTFAVLLGNGNGTFAAPVYYPVSGGALKQLFVADFDRDSKLDVAVVDNTGGSVQVFKGNGDGTFVTTPVTLADPGGSPYGIFAADLNGDQKLDLVVANSATSSVSIYLSNGDGTFQPRVLLSTGATPMRLTIADINLDGRPDLAVAQRGSDSIGVFLAR